MRMAAIFLLPATFLKKETSISFLRNVARVALILQMDDVVFKLSSENSLLERRYYGFQKASGLQV